MGIVKARSVAGGAAIYLVLDWPDFSFYIREAKHIGYEALVERIVHDAVAANLTKAVMNSVNKKLSSLEEPEFTWTVPCHEMMQTSVRKNDSNWTDRDSISAVQS